MTLLNRHIAVVLLMAVFSLTTHAAIYHGPETMDDHAQEQEHGHADSDTCIASLAHVQMSFGQVMPIATRSLVAVIPIQVLGDYVPDASTVILGRAPPCS